VLDPAGLGQQLLVFELVAADFGARVVEDHAPRTGGALVDGCDEIGRHSYIMDYLAQPETDIATRQPIGRTPPRGGESPLQCAWSGIHVD
jgi:hypothetical protein